MKKILLPILVIVIAFAAMGCGVTNSNERNATDDKKQSDTENNASNDTADTSAPDDSSADKADDKELDINSFYFNAYEDGFAVDSYIFTEGIGVKDLNGTASPGRKIKGALVYEVSEDFKELEIEYQPSFWNDKKALFIYTNK